MDSIAFYLLMILPGLFGVAIGLLVPVLIMKSIGWDQLCDRFPPRRDFDGPWLGFQTLTFGGLSRLNNCVSVGFSNDYLHVKLWRPLFPFAKSMQIPWVNVASITHEGSSITMPFGAIRVRLDDGRSLTFRKLGPLQEKLTTHLQQIGMSRLIASNDSQK